MFYSHFAVLPLSQVAMDHHFPPGLFGSEFRIENTVYHLGLFLDGFDSNLGGRAQVTDGNLLVE